MKTMKREAILKDIIEHFERTTGTVEADGECQPRLSIVTDHGKADRIGQYALSKFSGQVQTYFACHTFRKAHLSIYFNR